MPPGPIIDMGVSHTSLAAKPFESVSEAHSLGKTKTDKVCLSLWSTFVLGCEKDVAACPYFLLGYGGFPFNDIL